MKAMIRTTYGGPEVLEFVDIDPPTAGDGELLVRVEASSVNPADRYFMMGWPKLVQMQLGFRRPKVARFGIDVAGTVEAVGAGVTGFAVGERIVGASGTGYAELAIVRQGRAAVLPTSVSASAAAALPVAGCTALQALRHGQVGPGTKLLINGASGGVGHLTVQLAVAMGAQVTAVCSRRNVELVESFGAHEVLAYDETDYATLGRTWDVLVDIQGNHPPAANRDVLVPKGRLVAVGGPMTSDLAGPVGHLLRSALVFAASSRKMKQFTASETAQDIATLVAHVADGSVTPHVDKTFPLADLGAAMDHLATGRTRGKLLITVPG